MDGFSNEILRIHPRRVVAWNLDGPGIKARTVGPDDAGALSRQLRLPNSAASDPLVVQQQPESGRHRVG